MRLITRKQGNFTNLFDDFFSPYKSNNLFMKTDISKRKGNYVFDIDIPGYKKEDIKVTFEDGYLNVWLEDVRDNCTDDDCEVISTERFNGKYSRSFYLGHHNYVEINATYHNGVLTIVVPDDSEKAKEETKFIEIK